jgi:hypothetical protein
MVNCNSTVVSRVILTAKGLTFGPYNYSVLTLDKKPQERREGVPAECPVLFVFKSASSFRYFFLDR